MKRWLKNTICIACVIISIAFIVSIILYLNGNQVNLNGSDILGISNKIEMKYLVLLKVGIVFFTISLSYLLFSKFGLIEVFKNRNKSIIYIIINIIFVALLILGMIYITNTYILKPSNSIKEDNKINGLASYKVDNNKLNESNKTYESNKSDTSVFVVGNNGSLILTDVIINKLEGETTNIEKSDFYGINSALLVEKNSSLNFSGKTITTSAKGSNAVFATGTNAIIYIGKTTINTTNDSSRGLDVTYGGYIEGNNLIIDTKGKNSASIATDKGGGIIIIKNSTLSTSGLGSPLIYSTGDIRLSDSTGISNKAQIAVIEGMNNVTINNSKLTTYALGNKENIDQSCIMIYQSTSNDESVGAGTLNVTDSTLKIDNNSSVYKTAPMFFITNTNAIINIENTILEYGSNNLISIKATDEWGKKDFNGGKLTLNAIKQTLKGNISVDNISSLTMNLNESIYEGVINKDNTAKKIAVILDYKSTWNVTGDSHVSIITDEDNAYTNIKSNGYTIYYNKDLNTSLNGKTINLLDGGKLVAE